MAQNEESMKAWRTQRSNVGHAQGFFFKPAARQFPAQSYKRKQKKQPLSRKICQEEIETLKQICVTRTQRRQTFD